MSLLVEFYKNKAPILGSVFFKDIVNDWTDYDLETIGYEVTSWLFPTENPSNINEPILTDEIAKLFKRDKILRLNVVKATLRFLNLYGYDIDSKGYLVQLAKHVRRRRKGVIIGLFNPLNYRRIETIMTFLNKIELSYLSMIFFLAMCTSMRSYKKLKKLVEKENALSMWINTQQFLQPYIIGKDLQNLSLQEVRETIEIEDSDDDIVTELVDDDIKADMNESCQLKGLKNVSNSCYMDSVLVALFAVPNQVINQNILDKNISSISNSERKWLTCSNDSNLDYEYRLAIQRELKRINNSIHEQDNVKYCSMLRSMIKRCPGPQKFHGGRQQDSGEFLAYLFNLFQVDVATKSETTYVTNDMVNPNWLKIRTRSDFNSTPMVSVSSHHILEQRSYYMNEFLVQIEDSVLSGNNLYKHDGQTYSRRRSVSKVESSPYIVFNVHRNHFYVKNNRMRQKKLNTDIIPVLKIRNLNLRSIVVHEGGEYGGHYTAYIRCGKTWFFYDDLRNSISEIGTYTQMLNSEPNPRTDGVQYFYT